LPEGQTQDQVNADETPTKVESRKAWLWTFVARMFTVFAVRLTREATAVDELLTAAVRPLRRHRTDEQCGRTRFASRGNLAQALPRHAKRRR
jgi:hypothetical protein